MDISSLTQYYKIKLILTLAKELINSSQTHVWDAAVAMKRIFTIDDIYMYDV